MEKERNNNSEVTMEDINRRYNEVENNLKENDENVYSHNASGNGRNERRNINAILMDADEQIFTAFSQANEGLTAKNKNELSQEDRQKYDEFLKSEEVGKIYDETDKKVKTVNKDRNVRLANAAKDLDKLRQDVDEKLNEINPKMEEIENEIKEQIEADKKAKQDEINEKQEEIDALSKETDGDSKKRLATLRREMKQLQGEYAKLENGTELKNRLAAHNDYTKLKGEKEQLENIRNKIGPSKDELNNKVSAERKNPKNKGKSRDELKNSLDEGLSKDLRLSLANQRDLRDKAKDKAKEVFGEDRVKDDFGISKQNQEKADKVVNEKGQAVPENPENQPTEEKADNSTVAHVAGAPIAGGAHVAGGAPVAGGAVAPGVVAGAVPEEGEPEEEVDPEEAELEEDELEENEPEVMSPEEIENLTIAQRLGLTDDKNALNSENSKNALKIFIGEEPGPDGKYMDDETRMEILSSPEGTMLVRDAVARTSEEGKHMFTHFFKSMSAKRLNKKVLDVIKEYLPNYVRERNGDINPKDLENVYKDLDMNARMNFSKDVIEQINNMKPEKVQMMKEKISELNSSYDNMTKKYEEALKSESLSDEDRKNIQDKLNNINEKKSILDKSFKSYVNLRIGADYAENAKNGNKANIYTLGPAKTAVNDDSFMKKLKEGVKEAPSNDPGIDAPAKENPNIVITSDGKKIEQLELNFNEQGQEEHKPEPEQDDLVK